ncbi:hypothetical protein E2P81_ATG06231 [Venturia nashicola]|nr:hypothetical protein E2P81_ATG06231 [Venturia nashicola]
MVESNRHQLEHRSLEPWPQSLPDPCPSAPESQLVASLRCLLVSSPGDPLPDVPLGLLQLASEVHHGPTDHFLLPLSLDVPKDPPGSGCGFGFALALALLWLWLCFGSGSALALLWLWLWLCSGSGSALALALALLCSGSGSALAMAMAMAMAHAPPWPPLSAQANWNSPAVASAFSF